MKIHHVEVPSTIEEAYQLLVKNETNKVVGGGAWMRLSNTEVTTMIMLDELGLDDITETEHTIEIGAMTTLRTIETNEIVQGLFNGILCDAVRQIMGIQVRNIATIGGSVMGKYSFSDILPVLLVMRTTLRFYKHGEIRLKDYLEYKKMEPDILLSVIIEKEEGKGYFHKVSKTVLDFSILNLAISHTKQYNIQVGARPGSVKPAKKAMDYLNECTNVGEDEIRQAVELAMIDVSVSANVKASKEYREDVLKAYLVRGLKEVM